MKAILKLTVTVLISFSLSAQSHFKPEVLNGSPMTGFCENFYLFTINDTINNQFLIETHNWFFNSDIFHDTISGLNSPWHVGASFFNYTIDFSYRSINAFGYKNYINNGNIDNFDTTIVFNNEIYTVFHLSNRFSEGNYFNVITFDYAGSVFYVYRNSLPIYISSNNIAFQLIDSFSIASKKIEMVNNVIRIPAWQNFPERLNQAVFMGRDSLNRVELFYLRIPLFNNDNTVKITRNVLFNEEVNTVHFASLTDSILYFLSSNAGEVYAHSFNINDSIFSIDTIGAFPQPISIFGNNENEIYLSYPMLDSLGNAIDSVNMIRLNVNNWLVIDTSVIPFIPDTIIYVNPEIIIHHHDSTKQYLSTYNFTSNTFDTFYETTASGFIQYSVNPWCIASVNDTELMPYKIFPNPTNNQINIQGEMQHIRDVTICDVSGKNQQHTLLKTDDNLYVSDISKLSDGLYFLQIHLTNGETLTKKIMKH